MRSGLTRPALHGSAGHPTSPPAAWDGLRSFSRDQVEAIRRAGRKDQAHRYPEYRRSDLAATPCPTPQGRIRLGLHGPQAGCRPAPIPTVAHRSLRFLAVKCSDAAGPGRCSAALSAPTDAVINFYGDKRAAGEVIESGDATGRAPTQFCIPWIPVRSEAHLRGLSVRHLGSGEFAGPSHDERQACWRIAAQGWRSRLHRRSAVSSKLWKTA